MEVSSGLLSPVPCPFKDNDLTSRAAWLEIRKQLFPAPSSFICVRVLRDLKQQAACLGAMLIKQEGDSVHFYPGPLSEWRGSMGGLGQGIRALSQADTLGWITCL